MVKTFGSRLREAWSLLFGRRRPAIRSRSYGGGFSGYSGLYGGTSLYGQGYGEDRINVSNISYAQVCISILSQSIRSIPLGVYQLNEGSRRGGGLKRLVGHPIDMLLQFPSERLSRVDTIDVLSRRVLEEGNSFLIIRRDNRGTPIGLETTGEEIEANAILNEHPTMSGGQYTVSYTYTGSPLLEVGDICHFKMWPDEDYGGVVGKPQQYRQQNLFRSAGFYDKYISDTLGKSPAYLLKMDDQTGTITEGAQGGPDERKKQIMNATTNSIVVDINSNEDIKHLNNSQEVSALGISNFLLLGMSRAYGVPVGYLQTDEKQGVNPIELQTAQLAAQGLRWLASSIESELTLKLLTIGERLSGKRVLFNLNNFTQSSYQTKLTSAIQGSTSGILTINEARELLGQPLLEGEAYNKLYLNKAQQPMTEKEGVGEQGSPGVANQGATDYQKGGGDMVDVDNKKQKVGYKKAKV